VLIVVPALNEGAAIGDVVRKILQTNLGARSVVLVVDDGSADDTNHEARRAGGRVVTLIRNLGYGYALQTGYKVALEEGFDAVVQIDGDGQHAPESIPDLLKPVLDEDYDVVVGSRALATAPYAMPLTRRLGQRLFSWVLEKLSGLRILDPTSGFQALGRRALALSTKQGFPADYPDADVLLFLKMHGLRIKEVPALFRPNPRGTSMHSGLLNPLYYIYKMPLSMFIVYIRHRSVKNQRLKNEGDRE
jgi:glycosyltransferase involved in cell wall biosynthesis